MRVYYDRDADLKLIQSKRVAVVGYGAQGAAHALNLRDSGVKNLTVALRDGSARAEKAKAEGLRVVSVAEAARDADVLMILAPDEKQPEIYEAEIAPYMRAGKTLLFAHGFAVHFKFIQAPPEVDVAMVAPKGQGRGVRNLYLAGGGVPCLVAVEQDASGSAMHTALSYGAAIGGGRPGMIEATFRDECESDLFSEQAVLCGGLPYLIRAGFETLVEAGYPPEIAYFECLHEVKLIVDLLYEQGLDGMNRNISNTAEYGEYVVGPRIVNDATRAEMRRVLADIQSGKFARDWMAEYKAGLPSFSANRREAAEHPIEEVGKKLRAMMPWIVRK